MDSDGANSPYWYNPSLDTSNRPIGNASDNHFYPLMISSQGGLAEYWIRFRFWDMEGTKYGLEWPDDVWYQTPTGGYFKPGDTYAVFISYSFADSIAKGLAKNNRDRYTYGELGGRFFGRFIGLRTGMYVRQVTFSRFVGYNQLAYKDDNGVEHTLSQFMHATIWAKAYF